MIIFWFDRYCQNLFANGFEADIEDGKKYELLTAFEVFEHLADPMSEIQAMSKVSDNILFSTDLLPSPAPPINKWWYYAPEHGQHIAFFTLKSLMVLAERLGAHLCSNKGTNMHLITKHHKSDTIFNYVTRPRLGNGSIC